MAHPEHGDALEPSPARIRQKCGCEGKHERDGDEARVRLDQNGERMDHVADACRAVHSEVGHDRPGERQRLPAQAGDCGGGEDARERLERAPGPPAGGLHGQREHRDRTDRREQRSRDEQKACTCVAPADREPGEGDRRVRHGSRLGDVPEREDRHEEGDREPESRHSEHRHAGSEREEEHEAGRPERQQRRGERDGEGRERCRDEPPLERQRCRSGLWGCKRLSRPRRRRPIAPGRGERGPQVGCKAFRRRAARRLDRERRRDGVDDRRREIGTGSAERLRPRLDRRRNLGQGDAPERVLPDERLPEHHADGPDVTGGRRVASTEALGCDVRERAGHVTDGGQRVGLVELGQAEVEEPDRDQRRLLDEDVRRLHIPMDDPDPVGVGERVENLRSGLDGVAVAELAGAQGLAQRAALDVLVGDVDVAAVTAEVVGADASLMAKPRRCFHLPCRPGSPLALARDDLQGDLETGSLVPREPDRSGPAAAERPEGPVAVENEVGSGKGVRGTRHGPGLFAVAGDRPSGRNLA